MEINKITEKIIGCAMKVHTKLGPGLLESAYEVCLHHELVKSGLKTERQKPMPLYYDELKMDIGYRLDFLIEETIVVEIKSVDALSDIHIAQVLTYLNLSKSKVGLLLNFNVVSMKEGIKRLVSKDFSSHTNQITNLS